MVQYVNDLNSKLEKYVKTKHTTVKSFPCRREKTLENIQEYSEFNHVYVMYFVAGKIFTVHYEIVLEIKSEYHAYLKINSLEMLKHDESKDTFVTVSKVIKDPDLESSGTYMFANYTYTFDLKFNTKFGNFSPKDAGDYKGCNRYYNYSEYNEISPYFRFSSAVLAKDN